MLRYEEKDRIPIISLYNNLCDIMHMLECQDQLSKFYWFPDDVDTGEFKYSKLKKQA